MTDNHYGTVATLKWILSHYFYGGEHYAWLSAEYYPYRRPNPPSSDPHAIYETLYKVWKDRDDFNNYVDGVRESLRRGVMAQEKNKSISAAISARLKDVCDQIDIFFLYPIVYRVDVEMITNDRLSIEGSGATVGSWECLVRDLQETEFDILFLDFESDPDFRTLVIDERAAPGTTSPPDALNMLVTRCSP